MSIACSIIVRSSWSLILLRSIGTMPTRAEQSPMAGSSLASVLPSDMYSSPVARCLIQLVDLYHCVCHWTGQCSLGALIYNIALAYVCKVATASRPASLSSLMGQQGPKNPARSCCARGERSEMARCDTCQRWCALGRQQVQKGHRSLLLSNLS